MIQITNLNKSFNGFHALKDLSLTVKEGEIYGFIGKNGAGKSTTMNIIAGLSKQDNGTCIVNNVDVSTIKHPNEIQIGYLPENPNFQGWLTAYETLELLLVNNEKKDKKKIILDLIKWVGLEQAVNRRVGGFSRGMKQRLGLACALVNEPELIILDEPSSALDPEGRADVLSLIIDLKQKGKTIILSTHILSDVERVCDRVGLLKDGHLIMEKDLQELLDNHRSPILDIEYDGVLGFEIEKIMRNMRNVENVEVTNSMISLSVTSKEHIKSIMKQVITLNINMTGISVRKKTLEDLFIKEVNNNENTY